MSSQDESFSVALALLIGSGLAAYLTTKLYQDKPQQESINNVSSQSISLTGKTIPVNPEMSKQQRLNQLLSQRQEAEEFIMKSGDQQAIQQLMLAKAQPQHYQQHLTQIIKQNDTLKKAVIIMAGLSVVGMSISQVNASDMQEQLSAINSELSALGTSLGNIEFNQLGYDPELNTMITPLDSDMTLTPDDLGVEAGIDAMAEEGVLVTADVASETISSGMFETIMNGIFG